jgi:hypothetical protein
MGMRDEDRGQESADPRRVLVAMIVSRVIMVVVVMIVTVVIMVVMVMVVVVWMIMGFVGGRHDFTS